MKLLITGGHLAPALALIEKIHEHPHLKSVEAVFVGRKYPLESEKTLSLEYKEITKRGMHFIPLEAGRIARIMSFRTFRSLIKIPLGFFQAFQIIRNERPTHILCFGGYVALPIACFAFLFRIPVYTHEQTIRPGLANRVISVFSKKVFISFEETASYFNPKKTLLVGNPVRSSIKKIIKKPFIVSNDTPVLYVTGGSLGSHSINQHIKEILKPLLEHYRVIHQVGDTKEYHDYEDLLALKKTFSPSFQDRYFLAKHFFEDELGYIYSISDVVVGRAGANTFFELIALEKPTIFIPLPWSAYKEQQHQAELFKNAGVGEIFNQSEKSSALLALIDHVVSQKEEYQKQFHKLRALYTHDAAETIITEIFGV